MPAQWIKYLGFGRSAMWIRGEDEATFTNYDVEKYLYDKNNETFSTGNGCMHVCTVRMNSIAERLISFIEDWIAFYHSQDNGHWVPEKRLPKRRQIVHWEFPSNFRRKWKTLIAIARSGLTIFWRTLVKPDRPWTLFRTKITASFSSPLLFICTQFILNRNETPHETGEAPSSEKNLRFPQSKIKNLHRIRRHSPFLLIFYLDLDEHNWITTLFAEERQPTDFEIGWKINKCSYFVLPRIFRLRSFFAALLCYEIV